MTLSESIKPIKEVPAAFNEHPMGEVTTDEAAESALWLAFLQGSDSALAKIFERYAHKLFNYGRQFTKDTEIINDAVQDVFYQVIRSKHKLGMAQSIKYYLFSSFRRRLLRLIKQRRRVVLDEDFEKTHGFQLRVDPDYHSISTQFTVDQRKVLEEACNRLPVRQREILALYFFEGLSYKEIAHIMEFSQVKSARKLLYRTLDSLHGMLEKHKDILRMLFVLMG
ncbi:sigma-70 family RNA polymerase sigma factor [Echinicola strongylocentroti]|uniref:Sigma-70 family RNA polymerase sigma factor n=1 Tax=Echinicola strongylocentroti TaxID=1795355 RepID=A0A2Z4IE05_9BACT|nr:sigma-70 family RNA polymerase sigma factor [Echinicola strongylocentroti]AWW29292.1 sigma-70 family RNA polymerase sigma factor [Echinicola strongylocentroti]